MRIRRTILCLATIFFWTTHDPDTASGQSSELMETARADEAERLEARAKAIRAKSE